MNIEADLHIHTIGSGHAYSTIKEMAEAAEEKNIKMIAMTDHGPAMPDSQHEYYYYNMRAIPEKIAGVRVLKGVEANICKKDGRLDLGADILSTYEMVIASMHIVCTPEKLSKKENTQMYLEAMQNKYVDILGHIENPQFDIDIKEVVGAAKENKKIIEINGASFDIARRGSERNIAEVVDNLIENDMLTVVNSDAHIFSRVGYVDLAMKYILDKGFKKENILNLSAERTADYFGVSL